MPSVADQLRRDTRARVLAMPIADRIALSLSLGDEDLACFVRHAGLDPDTARRHLRAQRVRGRRPSGAAA